MELEVALGSRAAGVNMVWLRWGYFGSMHKAHFLFQLSRKYVAVASDFDPAGNSQVLGLTFFPLVYFNRSYCTHVFII